MTEGSDENAGEEGIEHENDGEESQAETVENENVDAVVDTRGVEMDMENTGEEKVICANNEEEQFELNSREDEIVANENAGQEGIEHESDWEEPEDETIENNRWHQAWDRLREKAGWAALSLGGLAVIIFCSATVTGIAEGNYLLWITSLSVVIFISVMALVA